MTALRSIGRAVIITTQAGAVAGMLLIGSTLVLPASLSPAAWLGARMGDASCVEASAIVVR